MDGYTLTDLRTALQNVRGETRVKAQEVGIRNAFLVAAVKEIFTEHNWHFNARTSELEFDSDGIATLPKNFSVMNAYWATDDTTSPVTRYDKENFVLSFTDKGVATLQGAANTTLTLHYYIKAPAIETEGIKVFFPQELLIAERAYVRLKTAYFPDENSEKELQRSKVALRQLYSGTKPKAKFTHKAL